MATMRATDFESRHQTLLHLLVVGAAFLTYAFEPDDIVWALVKHHTIYRAILERFIFGAGALMIIGSAGLQTWAEAYHSPRVEEKRPVMACDGPYRCLQYPLYFGRILFALGIGLLAPAVGTAILVVAEATLVVRLFGREAVNDESLAAYRSQVRRFLPSLQSRFPRQGIPAKWKHATRKALSKWGLAVTMIVFTITLRDRVAEFLAATSFLLWAALNLPELIEDRGIE